MATRRKKVEQIPVEDGEVIVAEAEETAEENTTVVEADTVVVCSNYPLDLKYEMPDGRFVIIKGNAHNLRGKDKGILPTGGAYGMTVGVAKADWEYIAATYKDAAYIKNGNVFASTTTNARAEAKERKDLRHGFEPVEGK